MKTTVHNIVAFSLPEEGGKEYTHMCQWALFTHTNFTLPVYHKREIKTIEWKDLGKKMSILYAKNQPIKSHTFNKESSKWCLTWFQWFDEEKWSKYYFLHDVKTESFNNIQTLYASIYGEDILTTHQWQLRIEHDLSAHEKSPDETLESDMSILYLVSKIYGKRDTREFNEEEHLRSISIQCPLLFQNTHLIEWFNKMHQRLQKQGYFNTLSIMQHSEWSTIQYTINDDEIISVLASFDLAKNYYITKKSSTAVLQDSFWSFCKEQDQQTRDIEWKYIKFLPKN